MSDMIQIDLTHNIDSIGICNSDVRPISDIRKYNNDDRNVVLYLPIINGFASNTQKDHLKATILNEIEHSCTYNKIEAFQFECHEKNITMTCDGSHGGSIKGICRRQLEPTCDTSLLTNIAHSLVVIKPVIPVICNLIIKPR
jgi:hypothetical protein